MKSGVYQILNVVTGRIYVGSAVSLVNRWSQHRKDLERSKHYNVHMQKSYNKHGVDAFEYFVIEHCLLHELIEKEQFWMDALHATKRGRGYNMCPRAGNCLGFKHSKETRHKMSAAATGTRNPNYGRVYSAEHKQRLSDAHKGIPSPNKGKKLKPHTAEAKRKIAEAGRGRRHSESAKRKVSQARSKYLTFEGRTMRLTDWAKELGITRHGLYYRLKTRPLKEALDPKMEGRRNG